MVVRSLGVAASIGALLVSGSAASGRPVSCPATTVHYTRHAGLGEQLGSLPWIGGSPAAQQLVGLLWYWPEAWRAEGRAKATIYSGGRGPDGRTTMKILWIFLAPKARSAPGAGQVVIKGHRLDGAGTSWQRFVEISYRGQNGVPYASTVDLPSPGCWRVDLSAGPLHASTVFEAISPSG
jgi:hypothetical protein